MSLTAERSFDPDTVVLMRSVLDRAVAELPLVKRTNQCKARLASVILDIAARGERDPEVLQRRAMMTVDDGPIRERSSPVDAAVLDVNLAGERVTPVAEVLRAMAVPFVLASGYGSAELKADEVLRDAVNIGKLM